MSEREEQERPAPREIVLVRHAETDWSREGRHTGRTDLPLSEHGRAIAAALRPALKRRPFDLVLVSPARRARETCELCGLAGAAESCEELWEWDYGRYEGLTTPQIRAQRPGWNLWRDGCPEGERADQVGTRADRVLARARAAGGCVALFAHGHVLRVLAARWIGLEARWGERLALSTASLSVLGHEHDAPVVWHWNEQAA